jgi:photosystem II stability/assembly factor-like uncharacterized protein
LIPCLGLLLALSSLMGKMSDEERAANEAIRADLPYGGSAFAPEPRVPVFMAAGHSGNVVISYDDGKTWESTFYGYPCGDHGYWTVWNSLAYTDGVFALSMGWGAPGTIIATDDGKTWRHLTGPDRQPRRKSDKPYDMPTSMHMIAVDGAFILPLAATHDFGQTWHETSRWGFRDAAGERIKVNLGHPSLAHDGSRVIAIGNEGPAVYSDDLGRTWVPMRVTVEPWEGRGAKGIIGKDGVFLIVKGDGATVLRSDDGGMTWQAHPLGVEQPAGRSFGLSRIGDAFIVTGSGRSRISEDGITWRDLPEGFPNGRIAVSGKGTWISVSRKRHGILRSTDRGETWEEVYTFTPDPGATGGAQGFADIAFGHVKPTD